MALIPIINFYRYSGFHFILINNINQQESRKMLGFHRTQLIAMGRFLGKSLDYWTRSAVPWRSSIAIKWPEDIIYIYIILNYTYIILYIDILLLSLLLYIYILYYDGFYCFIFCNYKVKYNNKVGWKYL